MQRLKPITLTAAVLALGVTSAGLADPGDSEDAGGTTGTAAVTETVSAATTEDGLKVFVCHRTHSKKKPYVTISVSPHALPAHLKHGDVLADETGSCVFPTTEQTASSKPGKSKGQGSAGTEQQQRQSKGSKGKAKGKGK